MRYLIGDADGIQGSGWKTTLKKDKDRKSVDWEAVAREVAPSEDHLVLSVESHTIITPGSRRFLFHTKKQ